MYTLHCAFFIARPNYTRCDQSDAFTQNSIFQLRSFLQAIAEPRFRFRKMQALGPVLLTVSPSVARLQWNRFLPTDAFLDKNVKVLWAPLEPPPVQRVEPLPVLESRAREPIPQPTPVVAPQPERPDTARQWRPAQTPVNDAAEQNWPSLGQATKIITEDRRERVSAFSRNEQFPADQNDCSIPKVIGISLGFILKLLVSMVLVECVE